MNYDKTDQAERYDAARAMAPEDQRRYLAALTPCLTQPPRLVIDLGCGTGRFSTALAEHFQIPVLGIDPARTMLAKARENVKDPRVSFLEGNAAEIPVGDGAADLVFVSMAWHHFPDPLAAAHEIRRVLGLGGIAAVRNSFVDVLTEFAHLQFFPAAKTNLAERLPNRHAFSQILISAGFEQACHHVFDQRMAPDWAAFCDKIEARALSELEAISDGDFEAGLAAMRREQRDGPVVAPIDLYAFRAA